MINNILIIDGHNTYIRCHSVINKLNIRGNQVGAIIGFIHSIGYTIKTLKPDKVIIVFDGLNSSYNRKLLYPEYKANRQNNIYNKILFDNKDYEKDSLINQFIVLKELLTYLPVKVIDIERMEADDLIYYISKNYLPNSNKIIYSNDNDFLQLVGDKLKIFSPIKKEIIDTSYIKKKYNLIPENFIIEKIFSGCNSDNIKGIKSFSTKKIQKYFPEIYQDKVITLEDIFNICESKKEDKIYKNILDNKDILLLNDKLINFNNINIHKIDIDNINNILDNISNNFNLFKLKKLCIEYFINDSISSNFDSYINNIYSYLKFKK